MNTIPRKSRADLLLARMMFCIVAGCVVGGAIWLRLQPRLEPLAAQSGIFQIELPELNIAPTAQPELAIPSPNVNQIRLHISKPQADSIDYGQIIVKLNGEGTAGLYRSSPSSQGKLVTMTLNSLPGFNLVPGRNTVEIEATNKSSQRFYASFVLSTTSNRIKEFNYKTFAGSNPQQQAPPEIVLLEPESEVLFPAERPSIQIPIAGAATAVGTIERVTVGGKPVTLRRGEQTGLRKLGLANETNRVAFDVVQTVTAGTASIPVEAFDNFGNRTQLQIPVRVVAKIPAQEFTGQKYALIVGVSTFQHQSKWIQNLKYADDDAKALYDFLKTPGGGRFSENNMLLLTNEKAKLEDVRAALREFVPKPGPEDTLIVFLATHGGPDEREPQNLYFILHDTVYDNMSKTGLAMKGLQTTLEQNVRAKRMLLFVDTCHSAGLLESPTVQARGGNNLAPLYAEKLLFNDEGKAVITAADVNESSRESTIWGGGHGVFTHFLLEGLIGKADVNADGLVTIGELFRFVRQNVRAATRYDQTPRLLIGTNENLKIAAVTRKTANSSFPNRRASNAFAR